MKVRNHFGSALMMFVMLHYTIVAPAHESISALLSMISSGESKHLIVDWPFGSNENANIPNEVARDTPPVTDIPPSRLETNSNEEIIPADIESGDVGTSAIKPLDEPEDNLFLFNVNHALSDADKVTLVYDIYGVSESDIVARSINERPSFGGYLMAQGHRWQHREETLDPEWLKQGLNKVLFGLVPGTISGYRVRNVSLKIEKQKGEVGALVVSTLKGVTEKDGKVYVHGFVKGPVTGRLTVRIGNTFLKVIDKEFEGLITLSKADRLQSMLVVSASDENGSLGTEIVGLDRMTQGMVVREPSGAWLTKSQPITAGSGGSLELEDVRLTVPDSALIDDRLLSVSALRQVDLPPMNSGLVNVTGGARAYRFLPDGQQFCKPATIRIPYDENLLPKGANAKEIQTFYFDSQSKTWRQVQTDSVDVKAHLVYARTTHFTDYINGIIQTPETPEVSANVPTAMNGIEAADPAAEITMISPPEASQDGAAHITFPIKIPYGRQGMAPSLALNYSNERHGGWLGEGWALETPAITIDTRWGSPNFDPVSESEMYQLNGEALMYPQIQNLEGASVDWMPNRHYDALAGSGAYTTTARPRLVPGSEPVIFRLRNKSSFTKIERLGNSPADYMWKVTDTQGTVFYYGGDETGLLENAVVRQTCPDSGTDPNDPDTNTPNLLDPECANLATPCNSSALPIVHWALVKVVDVFANNMIYSYTKETLSGLTGNNANLNGGVVFKVANIVYTGRSTTAGYYQVSFEKESGTEITRSDIAIDARLGVKMVEPYLLKSITVKAGSSFLRKYALNYIDGEFNKKLLASVTEKAFQSGAEVDFYTQTFSYYNDVRKRGGELVLFSQGELESLPSTSNPNFTMGIGGFLGYSKLGASETVEASWDSSVTGGVQIRLWRANNKDEFTNLMVGFPLGQSFPRSTGYAAMVDVDGNGLDDIVIRTSNGLRYYPRYFDAALGAFAYGSSKSIDGVSTFQRQRGKTTTVIGESFYASLDWRKIKAFASRISTRSTFTEEVFFTDGNGDGLIDIVKDGAVLFNKENPATGGRSFVGGSEDTPNLLITANTAILPDTDPEPEENDPPMGYEAVRVWIAPKNGTIQITDNIQVTGASSQVATYSIETAVPSINSNTPFRVYLQQLTGGAAPVAVSITNYGGNNPSLGSGSSAPLDVTKGQRFYFRINRASENGQNGIVTTHPTITYINEPNTFALKDENLIDHTQNDYQSGFMLNDGEDFVLPAPGTITVTWNEQYPQGTGIPVTPTDDVNYEIYLVKEDETEELLYSALAVKGQPNHIRHDNNVLTTWPDLSQEKQIDFDNRKGETARLSFRVFSESNVKWQDVQWRPKLTYDPVDSLVPSGTLSQSRTVWPVASHSVYKSAFTQRLQVPAGTTNPGSVFYGIRPATGVSLDPTRNGAFLMVVKKQGQLLDKRWVTISNGTVSIGSNTPIFLADVAMDLSVEDPTDFTVGYYIQDKFTQELFEDYLAALGGTHSAVITTSSSMSGPFTPLYNVMAESMYNDTNYFGPMYKEWGQFFYNDDLDTTNDVPSDTIGKLINPDFLDLENHMPSGLYNPDAGTECDPSGDEAEYEECMEDAQLDPLMGDFPEEVEEDDIESVVDNLGNTYGPMYDQLRNPFWQANPHRYKKPDLPLVEKWQGLFDTQFSSAASARSGDFQGSGFDNVFPEEPDTDPTVVSSATTGMLAMARKHMSRCFTWTYGAKIGKGTLITKSKSKSKVDGQGYSSSTNEFIDINGDGYPDRMNAEKIQFTKATGGFSDFICHRYGNPGETSAKHVQYVVRKEATVTGRQETATVAGPTYSIKKVEVVIGGVKVLLPLLTTTDVPDTKNQEKGISGSTIISLGTSVNLGYSREINSWVDLNGDGLPDQVKRATSGALQFKLNKGGRRPADQLTSFSLLGAQEGIPGLLGVDFSVGYNTDSLIEENPGLLDELTFNISAGMNAGTSSTKKTLMDLNGDGLVDLVSSDDSNASVNFNNGNAFSSVSENLKRGGNTGTPSPFNLYDGNNSKTFAIQGGFYAGTSFAVCCIFIPIVHIKAGFSVGGAVSLSLSNTKKAFKDMNGDGYPDYVEKSGSNDLMVYYSNVGRTNMLQSVTNPFNGGFEVDYASFPVSYDNPNAKWVLKSVNVVENHDPLKSLAHYRKSFEYENPRYDRRERAFYGFEVVKTKDLVGNDVTPTVYRTLVQKYHNTSFFLNGLLKESYLIKGENESQLFSKTVNTYEVRSLAPGTGLVNPMAEPATYDTGGKEGRRSGTVLLTATRQLLYEWGSTPLITDTQMVYDSIGRVKEYKYLGDPSNTSDDYTTSIRYHSTSTANYAIENRNMLCIPKLIKVVANGDVLRKRATSSISSHGRPSNITIDVAATGTTCTINLLYDVYGNVAKATYPDVNYTYVYDGTTRKHVVRVTEDTGYISNASYDARFDKVLTTTDIGSNQTRWSYDIFGRTTYVTSPKEMALSTQTFRFSYYTKFEQVSTLSNKSCITVDNFRPFAITGNYDVQHASNRIETITFIDGLGRPMQVKKDIEVNTNANQSGTPTYAERMAVTGLVAYDELGRVTTTFHPFMENKGCNYIISSQASPVQATETTYDEVDRAVSVTDADGHTTTTSYAISSDGHVTTTNFDNNGIGIESRAVADANGRTVKSINVGPSGDIETSFTYDPIGQLMSYKDAANLTTSYKYDMVGHKVFIDNPDRGVTLYTYDAPGKLIKVVTANLAATNEFVTYTYTGKRLTGVEYPAVGGNPNVANVQYFYGSPTETDTSLRGRVIRQTDATGEQTFKYGNMGEVIETTRTVVAPTPGYPTRTFTTQYVYDSFNRVQSINYPDGEVLTYEYNLGGDLLSVEGTVNGSAYKYIDHIDYDHFGQRTFMKYGNQTQTYYTYSPGMRRLTGLQVTDAGGSTQIINNTYSFDWAGNVKQITNSASPYLQFAGTTEQTFTYDNLNRLIGATGSFTGDTAQLALGNDSSASYTLSMSYNTTHGVKSKNQSHQKNGAAFAPNTYNSTYDYYTGTHRVKDVLNTTVTHFDYDNDGNVKTRIPQGGAPTNYYWDEADRLRVVADATSLQHYIYDANGERVLKASSTVQSVYNNGTMVSPGSVTLSPYITYPSGLLTITGSGQYTKHYFAGTQRIVSQIGSGSATQFDATASQQRMSAEADSQTPKFDADKLKKAQMADLNAYLSKAKLGKIKMEEVTPQPDTDAPDAEADELTIDLKACAAFTPGTAEYEACLAGKTDALAQQRAGGTAAALPTTPQVYFFHPDHLGSSTLLTDANGKPHQFFLNLPFGETMAEQKNSNFSTPYKFTGKELDEETGMYYFGARFYDPKYSVWMSVDPLLELQPDEMPYHYCSNNPISRNDPTGMIDGDSTHTDKDGNVIAVYDDGDLGVYMHGDNADGKTPTKYQIDKRHEKSTSAGGKKMGETAYWDEFIVPDTDRAEGTIHYAKDQWSDWKPLIDWGNYYANRQDLTITMNDSKSNQILDIKTNGLGWAEDGPMTGRLLNGKFATARSAGNYLAGLNGITGTLQGQHISGKTYMKLAGAYQVLGEGFSTSIAFYILMTGATYGPAPYYGEENYSGRRIQEGINAGYKILKR